jgi:hypothetical protein
MMIMKRQRTLDREATPVLTVEQLGPKRSKTPEGFLLCQDVPLARTGTMRYGPGETPVKTRDGVAHISRDAATLFDERTLASFNGKPVVDEHPDTDVSPNNWAKHTKGVVLNPRRGTGDYADCMVADLLITDAATIREVEAGKREVSAGYDADYEDLGGGDGRQKNIIGNHVALVEKGRCGPRCAIGDHQPSSLKENSTMATKTQGGNRARRQIPENIRRLFRDAAAIMDADPALAGDETQPDGGHMEPDGDEGDQTHIHIHAGGGGAAAPGGDDPVEARFQAIEAMLQQIMDMLSGGGEEAPPEGGAPPPEMPDDGAGGEPPADELPPARDRATVGDSAALQTSYDQLASDAEVLVPGYRLPTFDGARTRASTLDSMCAQRRAILGQVYATRDGQQLVDNVAGQVDLNAADCAAVAVIFRAAAGAKRLINNQTSTRDAHTLPVSRTQVGAVGKVTSIAELNASYKAHYASKGKGAAQ